MIWQSLPGRAARLRMLCPTDGGRLARETTLSPRVLVVEDDPETRHFYMGVLAADGFHTYEAHNGFQALAKAIETLPDLVLTDIAVPGLDGIELCRRLRADPSTCAVRVLAVTGDDRRIRIASSRREPIACC